MTLFANAKKALISEAAVHRGQQTLEIAKSDRPLLPKD